METNEPCSLANLDDDDDDDDDTLYVRYRAPYANLRRARVRAWLARTRAPHRVCVPVRVETKVLMGDLPCLHAIHT